MSARIAAVFAITFFLAQFYPHSSARSEPLQAATQVPAGESQGVALPRRDALTLVSMDPVNVGGVMVGYLATYDDVATRRWADYLEFYDTGGSIVAVSWFDRFGIERLAVDRALAEHGDQLQGVLVLLVTGDTI
jgi:hypothetical protein